MKITAVEVEGFGVWTGLRLDALDDGLNVFFGPNEAGKTTLMQFVRAILYGWSPERRRYLPPRYGGPSGGSLWVRGPQGEFRVMRFDRSREGGPDDDLQIVGVDGFAHGRAMLPAILCNIDEPIFNNVFAVGLEELQELATLNDTQAAALLYNLSVGLDRVSLIDVMRELHGARNRLIDAGGAGGEVLRLLAERDRLQAEIESLGSLANRYARLAGERDQVDRETAQLEDESRQLARQLRIVEIAQSIRSRLENRRVLEEQLAALGKVESLPEADVPRLERINEALVKRERQWEELVCEFQRLRREAEAEKVDSAVLRQAPRIEALVEQENWIRSLEDRILELESEIAAGENEWKTHCDRLRLPEGSIPAFSPRSLAVLRPVAREVRRCTERLDELREQAAAREETQRSLASRLQSSLDARGEKQLGAATERLSALVAQLRRRLQLDQRFAQMQRYREELEKQRRTLLGQQMLPGWILTALGALFIVGMFLVLLTIWNVFSPTSLVGSLGWPMASFGLVFSGVSIGLKIFLQRANARRLEKCQQQIRALRSQMKQNQEDRETLDRQLPKAPGTIEARLEAAERELAALEELAPLDAQRETARQESEVIAVRLKEAEADLANARRRWQESLVSAGFPQGISPKQVRQLIAHAGEIQNLHERIQRRREELEHRSAELETLTNRIAQLVVDLQVKEAGRSTADRLHALVDRLRAEESRWKRRQELLRQARQMRPKRLRAKLGVVRLKRLKRLLLDRAGAADEVEFRRRAADQARASELRAQRDAVQREIEATLAGYCTEAEVLQQIDAPGGPGLEIHREQLQKRLEACAAQLKQRYEHRGQLAEQTKGLAENREPAVKRLELAMVEKRLDDAIRRWQVLALTHQVLERIRKSYERTRQPETLQEASTYLERMTQGRYRRVWTPLDADVLVVEDEEHRSHSVEVLSRGAREQLFLCLRLALAASYGRRGAHLPLVLDDVLVNFDAQRVKAAASVLHDFAKSGHQLMVFTCHEHIARIFQALRVEVHELPERSRLPAAALPSRKPPARPPRKRPTAEPPEEVAANKAANKAVPVREEASGHVAEQGPPSRPEVPAAAPSVPLEPLPPWEADDSEPPPPETPSERMETPGRPSSPGPLEGLRGPFDDRPNLVQFFEEPDAEDAEAA